MALIECNFFSQSLGVSTEVTVIVPEPVVEETGAPPSFPAGGYPAPADGYPTLYLLHGLGGDHTGWTRRTSIERYADERRLAVIMPSGNRSFYTDQATGYRYWTYLTEELPAMMRHLFPVSAKRDRTFVAGLSMGGYGALKWALRSPESFAAAASLSGALDVASFQPDEAEWIASFGDQERLRREGNDVFELVRAVSPERCPKLYQWCGTSDELYEQNLRFRDVAADAGLPLLYEEGPGGHEWERWDAMIRRVIDWLPLGPSSD